ADFSVINEELIKKLLIPSCANNYVILVNGNYSSKFSKITNQNINIKELSNLNTNCSDDLLVKFNELADYSKNPFLAINTALSSNSLLIEAAGNAEVEDTLQIIYIIDSSNEALMVNSQIYLNLGTSSSLDIVETINHIGYN